MVLGVGVELGRQAAAEYRLARHLTGRLDSHACAQCLEAIGKQFQWELQASVKSNSVICIDELGCAAAKLGKPDPYLMEVGYGILGGIVADEFGYAKVCMIHHPGMPPFHRTITIYLQDTTESRAASGIVFPQIVDEAAQVAERLSRERLVERLTPRETEVFQLIARGLSDKEIAAALRLSVRTVENHAAKVRHKLGVGSRTALVRLALRAPVSNVQEM
jgi:DNA-binding CsgD family transcriptional regulator